jgi:hypothetical protein
MLVFEGGHLYKPIRHELAPGSSLKPKHITSKANSYPDFCWQRSRYERHPVIHPGQFQQKLGLFESVSRRLTPECRSVTQRRSLVRFGAGDSIARQRSPRLEDTASDSHSERT